VVVQGKLLKLRMTGSYWAPPAPICWHGHTIMGYLARHQQHPRHAPASPFQYCRHLVGDAAHTAASTCGECLRVPLALEHWNAEQQPLMLAECVWQSQCTQAVLLLWARYIHAHKGWDRT
jgi:hypothetical protein